MARRSHQTLSAAVAGACLTLGACGTTAAPAASGSSPASVRATAGATAGAGRAATLAGHFCGDASSFMRHIPAGSTSKHLTQAQARFNLRVVLRSTVRGFTHLRAEAPGRLRKPLTTIIGVYRSDERVLRTTGNLATISESMVRGNAAGSAAFQRVIKYISVSCK